MQRSELRSSRSENCAVANRIKPPRNPVVFVSNEQEIVVDNSVVVVRGLYNEPPDTEAFEETAIQLSRFFTT